MQQSTNLPDLGLNILLELLSPILMEIFPCESASNEESLEFSYKRNRGGPFLRVLSRTESLRRLTRCALNNSALILAKLKKKQVTNSHIMAEPSNSKLVSA